MFRVRFPSAALAVLLIVAVATAQDAAPALQTAMGTVDKVAKDSLTIRPRGPEGRFAKNITLRITGTSKVTTLSIEKRGGKPAAVQRDTDPKDLQPGQGIAVIYTTGGMSPVLLSAVAQSASEK